MLSFVTQMFSGHLGAVELAGASIANVGIQGLAYGIMVCLLLYLVYSSHGFYFVYILVLRFSHELNAAGHG